MKELDTGWELLLTAMKSVLVLITSVAYLLMLVIFCAVRSLFDLCEWAHETTQEWKPVRPSVFDLEMRQ